MYKVLVLAYYFPPLGLSGVQRTTKFVKYMKDYNWEPVVLTTDIIGYYAYDYTLLKELEEKNIHIERVSGNNINSLLSKKKIIKMPPEILRKIFSRLSSIFYVPDNKTNWSKKAYQKAKELLSKEHFDLIFVSGPPFSAFNTGLKLKNEFGIPLVVDYRDLWLDNQFIFYPTPFHRSLIKSMEYKVLKGADNIIATNRRMKEKIIDNYGFLSFEDIYIVPHGYDPQDFENLKPEEKMTKKMRITYAGVFYEYITPKYFLKAFKMLLKERPDVANNIELNFIGILREENKKLIRKLKITEYIKEHGYINHKEALSKMMSSDLLWTMIGKGRNADTISMGKVFEYFGTRKPVLFCVPDGAIKSSAEEYKASFITHPYDVRQIKNALLDIYNLWVAKNLPTPDEEFIEKHRRDFLTEQLIKQFQLVVKEKVL
ncbi:MAG TPA: glycosyltransferase [Ignavibacteriaceae bacterium]|nr:glycosyltransferase [Ignavibacteriaceae bacterium]